MVQELGVGTCYEVIKGWYVLRGNLDWGGTILWVGMCFGNLGVGMGMLWEDQWLWISVYMQTPLKRVLIVCL